MSIVIKNLNKIYPDGHHALKNINLHIPSGMFGLLGPNGAGKSTFMRILVAQMEATSGEIEMYGYDMLKDRKAVRSILGYLPQDFRFFAQYKTWEFLDYAARLSGMTQTAKRKDAVDKMLES
ncbi:MAG: ATP-binding cassette domain-containing protein, partial [Bacteroidales bacterium]